MKFNLDSFEKIYDSLPEIKSPKKKLGFNQRIMWCAIGIILYFTLGFIPLYGLLPTYSSQFETFAVLLAAKTGSIITLGIGPIVTASIILQLLVGAEILKLNTNSPEGKRKYQGIQKILDFQDLSLSYKNLNKFFLSRFKNQIISRLG